MLKLFTVNSFPYSLHCHLSANTNTPIINRESSQQLLWFNRQHPVHNSQAMELVETRVNTWLLFSLSSSYHWGSVGMLLEPLNRGCLFYLMTGSEDMWTWQNREYRQGRRVQRSLMASRISRVYSSPNSQGSRRLVFMVAWPRKKG